MTRIYGKLKKCAWVDPDWRKLSIDAQWLYMHLLSQPTTNSAGVFPVQITKWAKAASDSSVERMTNAARELDSAGLIIVDHDTEEGALRSFIADDEAGTNIFQGALKQARLVQSAVLRQVLLEEILKLDRAFSEPEEVLIEELKRSFPEGLVSESRAPSPAPSSAATTCASRPGTDPVETASIPGHDRVADELEGASIFPEDECRQCHKAQSLGPEAREGEDPTLCEPCNYKDWGIAGPRAQAQSTQNFGG